MSQARAAEPAEPRLPGNVSSRRLYPLPEQERPLLRPKRRPGRGGPGTRQGRLRGGALSDARFAAAPTERVTSRQNTLQALTAPTAPL